MGQHICSEIEYTNYKGESVHSDICYVIDVPLSEATEYRAFIHQALDEWLDNNGSGLFYIGDPALLED